MVGKSDRPLQIRLTEPVIFLRGPSTGLDFRGRPQTVRQDAPPAMLRGLLTLRLNKPTRIRKIDIKFEGKARTEWPEGIGPRRLETYEEHPIISESTVFYTYKSQSASRSRSQRRAASIGPGVSRWDDGELDDEVEMVGVPAEGEDDEDWINLQRGRDRIPRSASALPGTHDGSTWHRDGFSRRTSYTAESPPIGPPPGLEALSIAERGPSPAYTPELRPMRSTGSSRRSSLGLNGNNSSNIPSREPILSPIASAAPSRAASDRTGSTSTERRFAKSPEPASSDEMTHLPGVLEGPEGLAPPDLEPRISSSSNGPPPRPILDVESRRTSSNVRFEDPAPSSSDDRPEIGESVAEATEAEEEADGHPEEITPLHQSSRAASIRTNHSIESGSNTSISNGLAAPGQSTYHPASDAVQAISTVSTPAPSRPGSIYGRSSNEDPGATPTTNAPIHTSPLANPTRDTLPATSIPNSRRSSLRAEGRRSGFASAASSAFTSPSSSRPDLHDLRPEGRVGPEVRVGRSSRNGSHTTIIIHPEDTEPTPVASSSSSSANPALQAPAAEQRTASRTIRPGPSRSALGRRDSSEDRGRGTSKFSSLSAALRGLSQDVKDKVRGTSKSRTRAGSIKGKRTDSFSNPPPMPNGAAAHASSMSMSSATSGARSGSAIPSRVRDDSIRSGRAVTRDLPPGDFVPPHGAGGAGRGHSGSRDRDRKASPSPFRSESRSRGRNKGMKALTGAFHLGDDGDGEQDDEPVHHWKEFRKGTYNYPISFQVPVDAPPTIHAEFGSVIYKLKATVVRVGALTPNLVEEIEVTMIATPQEDDLEESENVIVERQWEEQMRYQIALSGKAFPIGGTMPISVRLMPLMKCRIHRLTVTLEEKTDYFAQNRKVARHEQPRKFPLLFVKQPDKKERIEPLLPILSDDPNAARLSPLADLARVAYLNNPSARPDFDIDQDDPELADDNMLANLLDPLGPWHLEQNLTVPDCSARVRFTTKHDKTNIATSHVLKVTIRVERGDDVAMDTKGRRKQFDIIIETPIKILDCRVNPAWNSLPSYSTSHPGSNASQASVCAIHNNPRQQVALAPSSSSHPSNSGTSNNTNGGGPSSRPPTDSRVSGLPPLDPTHPRNQRPPVNGAEGEDTLLERNIVFDRLMSGQETETGEVPPSYGEAVAQAVRRASTSQGQGRGHDQSASISASASRSRGTSRSQSRVRGEVVEVGSSGLGSRAASRVG